MKPNPPIAQSTRPLLPSKPPRPHPLTRRDLVAAIATLLRCRHSDAMLHLNALVAATKAAVARGEAVQLRGFCEWYAVNRPSRQRRNPKTGAKVVTVARRVVKCRASKTWRLDGAAVRKQQNSAKQNKKGNTK